MSVTLQASDMPMPENNRRRWSRMAMGSVPLPRPIPSLACRPTAVRLPA